VFKINILKSEKVGACLKLSYSEWCESTKSLLAVAFQLFFRVCHKERQIRPKKLKLNGKYQIVVQADDNLLDDKRNSINTKIFCSH
jgi:hypothetical protein